MERAEQENGERESLLFEENTMNEGEKGQIM